MSQIKIVENLFLGKEELSKLISFLSDDGYKKLLLEKTATFGLISNIAGFENYFKIEPGSNDSTIKVNAGFAVDSVLNLIVQETLDSIAVAGDAAWYWVKIKYIASNLEQGIVSIDTDGKMTGVNTEFTKVLRQQPNFPSKIKFFNTSLNNDDYEIVEIISDTEVILAGDFYAETDLSYALVGTFTPGYVIPSQDRYVFDYDSCSFSLVAETVSNTPPTFGSGEDATNTFWIARVKSTPSGFGSHIVSIEDKRSNFWKLEADFELTNIPESENPLIGIESIKWDHNFSTRDKNIVNVGWGFRTSNWSINSKLNEITINTGSGGKYIDENDFQDGDFDDWRLYSSTNKWYRIQQSLKVGSQINLKIEIVDINDFLTTSDELTIVPNAPEIEFDCNPTEESNIVSREKFTFSIALGMTAIPLLAYKDPTGGYNIQYRYRNHKTNSPWYELPVNSVGFMKETNFDDNGNQTSDSISSGPFYTSYLAGGAINLTPSAFSFNNFVHKIDLGDRNGVDYIPNLEASVVAAINRKLDFEVGVRKQTTIITGSSVLQGDTRFDLITTNAKAGSSFFIYVKTVLDNQFAASNTTNLSLKIYQDNTSVLYTFTQDEINKGEQFFICKFDGANWAVVHFDKSYNGDGVFRQGSEVVSTSTHILSVSGKNVLRVSGYYEHIIVENPLTANFEIDGLFIENGKFINNLKIQVSNAATKDNSIILNDYSGTLVGPYNQFKTNGSSSDKILLPNVAPKMFTAGYNSDPYIMEQVGFNSVGNGTVPIGGIIMYNGASAPTGYVLCVGGTVVDTLSPLNGNPVPDLRDKFVMGSGTTGLGVTGGANLQALVKANIPPHTHLGSGTTSFGAGFAAGSGALITTTPEDGSADGVGAGGADANHGLPFDNRPAYYVLAFIMRIK